MPEAIPTRCFLRSPSARREKGTVRRTPPPHPPLEAGGAVARGRPQRPIVQARSAEAGSQLERPVKALVYATSSRSEVRTLAFPATVVNRGTLTIHAVTPSHKCGADDRSCLLYGRCVAELAALADPGRRESPDRGKAVGSIGQRARRSRRHDSEGPRFTRHRKDCAHERGRVGAPILGLSSQGGWGGGGPSGRQLSRSAACV